MAGQTTDTFIDVTRQLEWEVSKEQFEESSDQSGISSPEFIVNIESQDYKLGLDLVIFKESKYKISTDPNIESNGMWVGLCLVMLPGDHSLKMEVKGIGTKTGLGYMPGKPVKRANGKIIIVPKIENIDETTKSRYYGTYAGSKEDFLKLFDKNKITVMATVRFYEDGNDFIKDTKREQNLLTQLRSISDLDTLADFTIVCGDREFKCHRVLLASRSTVFKAMILNDQFVETRQNSITIEKASPDMVEAMLEFISTGRVPDDIQEKAIDLINLADSYHLQDLLEICESSLINNLTVEGVIETLIAIDLHAPKSQNRQKILDFIKEEAAQVVKSSHWKEFVVKYPDIVTEIVLSLSLQAVN